MIEIMVREASTKLKKYQRIRRNVLYLNENEITPCEQVPKIQMTEGFRACKFSKGYPLNLLINVERMNISVKRLIFNDFL